MTSPSRGGLDTAFISWSGRASRSLAEHLQTWMQEFFNDEISFWLSSESIEPGRRWTRALAEELERQHFGILAATPVSVRSPWVLFEAGAIAKSQGTGRFVPLLYGIRIESLPEPLKQFQALYCEEKGVWSLVRTINRARGERATTEKELRQSFDERIDDLMAPLGGLPRELFPLSEILTDSSAGLRIACGSSPTRKSEAAEVTAITMLGRLIGQYGCDHVRNQYRIRMAQPVGPGELADANLLLVGGPNSNDITAEFIKLIGSSLEYRPTSGDSQHAFLLNGKVFENSGHEHMDKAFMDHGFLIHSRNPWNPKCRAVVIGGLSSRASEGIVTLVEREPDVFGEIPADKDTVMMVQTFHREHQLVDARVVETEILKDGQRPDL